MPEQRLTIEAHTIRSLTPNEIDTLNVALRYLSEGRSAHPLRWAAQAMLDQKMPENFFWASK